MCPATLVQIRPRFPPPDQKEILLDAQRKGSNHIRAPATLCQSGRQLAAWNLFLSICASATRTPCPVQYRKGLSREWPEQMSQKMHGGSSESHQHGQ
eukprot:270564-Pelagomonas_calceolata.AAC.1